MIIFWCLSWKYITVLHRYLYTIIMICKSRKKKFKPRKRHIFPVLWLLIITSYNYIMLKIYFHEINNWNRKLLKILLMMKTMNCSYHVWYKFIVKKHRKYKFCDSCSNCNIFVVCTFKSFLLNSGILIAWIIDLVDEMAFAHQKTLSPLKRLPEV